MKKTTREAILSEYLENKISMNKLAEKHGINRNTIRTWLYKNGLVNKYHKQHLIDKAEVIRLYVEERKSTEEIAPLFNVSTEPIHTILYKAGVHRRQRETMLGKWIGEKNPNWKGGMTTYEKWRRLVPHFASKMQMFKTGVKLRDNFTCKMCGSQTKLETNHIIPVRKIIEEKDLFDIANGITLCRKCHLSIHFKEDEYIDIFHELITVSDSVRKSSTAEKLKRVNSGNILGK